MLLLHSPDSIPAEIISANPQLKGWGSAFSNFSLQNKILKIYFITTKEAETKMHVANIWIYVTQLFTGSGK